MGDGGDGSYTGWFYSLKATEVPNLDMTLTGGDGEVGRPGDGASIIPQGRRGAGEVAAVTAAVARWRRR